MNKENNHLNIDQRYQLIPRTLIFLNHNEKVILIEKTQNASFVEGRLNGVGGHIEIGEDPFMAARREVLEETGLGIENLDLVALLFIDTNKNPGILVFIFKGDSKEGKIKESDEGKLWLLDKNEIKKEKQVMEDVPFLMEICETHGKNAAPRIIRYKKDRSGKLRIAITPI